MEASALQTYQGQFVDLTFTDGGRVRAYVLSVDPDALDNHVFYRPTEIMEPGPLPHRLPRGREGGFACSASDIAALAPTDGQRHMPPAYFRARPWWKFW